jgi:hypothetical protein
MRVLCSPARHPCRSGASFVVGSEHPESASGRHGERRPRSYIASEGVTNYLHADVRDPERILHEAARTLDFTRPVGLMLLGIIKYGGVARKP